jgi:hypothetical protein
MDSGRNRWRWLHELSRSRAVVGFLEDYETHIHLVFMFVLMVDLCVNHV